MCQLPSGVSCVTSQTAVKVTRSSLQRSHVLLTPHPSKRIADML